VTKASIIFITYCHEKFVADAIQSAMAQDYENLEIVVCDDASPDRTLEILNAELKACPPHINIVEAHSARNSGLHANFNRGLSRCTGDVIIAMSGDDVSLPNRVSQVVNEFDSNKNTMVVIHNWTQIDEKGTIIDGQSCKYDKERSFTFGNRVKCMYARSPVCGASASYRRILYDIFGEMIRGDHGEDNCFWFRGLLLGSIKYLPEPMVQWRSHASNLSNWSQGEDCEKNRRKHLQWLKRHNFIPQYSRDLKVAIEKKLITEERGLCLMRLVLEDFESKRLRRYSLSSAPWKLWIGSAMRLRRCSRETRFYRKLFTYYLKLRISKSYRERKYWKKRFG
jgi:glycosyltransferase involved in cell wall biosynthesis